MKGICEYRILRLDISKFGLDNCFEIENKDLHRYEIKLRESELIRTIKTLDQSINNKQEYPFIDSLIQINIGGHIKAYYQEIDKKMYAFDKFKLSIVNGESKIETEYKRLMSGSGNIRNSKALYVRSDLYDKVNQIILCGLPIDLKFQKLCKYNAYYGLYATDSKPVSKPNIIVVPDYYKTVNQRMDVITTDNKNYFAIDNDIQHNQEIIPFDGAGLISIQMAARWSKELGLSYIPGSFQIRAAGGIKGCLFTFDIRNFAKEIASTQKVVDFEGETWDIEKDNIDAILTASQFKFLKYYNSFGDWGKAFDTSMFGYRHTWNISDYALSRNEVKNTVRTTYQILQSLSALSDDEIRKLCDPTIQQIKKISTDVDEFVKFRGLIDDKTDDRSKENDYIPPYYMALKENKDLFNDPYIRSQIRNDLALIKRKAESGKLIINGNYQISCPDVYALAEWAFGLEPRGLIGADQVYSAYWQGRGVNQIAIWRNPHVSMEWVVDDVVSSPDMQKWYQYQVDSIITGLYSLEALRLGGSDTDGDELGSTDNSIIVTAAKRNMTNTIAMQEQRAIKHKDIPIPINDTLALIKIDATGMGNDIGSVVNRTSILWSLKQDKIIHNSLGKDITVADAIKIMSVIDSLTIDFIKSGTKPELPDYLEAFLKQNCKPIFIAFAQNTEKIGKIKAILKKLLRQTITQEEAQKQLEGLKFNLNN